ncbi:MAG TPA: hypothetical protein VK801_02505, partial [Caulobacteraceae bacterium]|nr:hypothetical protein [Caulobacteraceae bacterium]
MNFVTRWPSDLTTRDELTGGDLFAFSQGGRTLLALVVSVNRRPFVLILAEYGAESEASLP